MDACEWEDKFPKNIRIKNCVFLHQTGNRLAKWELYGNQRIAARVCSHHFSAQDYEIINRYGKKPDNTQLRDSVPHLFLNSEASKKPKLVSDRKDWLVVSVNPVVPVIMPKYINQYAIIMMKRLCALMNRKQQ